jgi:MFS family permease
MIKFVLVFLISFLLSVGYGSTIYVNSTFLTQFFPAHGVSLLYVLASLGSILLFFITPRLLRRVKKEVLLVVFLLIVALSALGMAISTEPLMAAVFFIFGASILTISYYCLDISLEELTSNHHTGAVRGLYWTFLNGGIALGPLLVSVASQGEALRPVYFMSAFISFGALLFALVKSAQSWQAVHHRYHEKVSLPFRIWWRKRNVRAVTLARMVLEIFFALMTIYTPLYLHSVLGFSWSELGIIFTVMLLPFVLLEWPAGEAADRWWGEKEIMTLGFFLTGTMVLIMPFLGQSFSNWLIVLLISRVGASLIEITTESYFFKKVSANDTGLISIFRLTRPISLIIGALGGALILGYGSYAAIFFVTALIVLFGMKESLYLKDTL